ncbi:MAG: acyl carrier protein [Micromonosporaceae bacterium]
MTDAAAELMKAWQELLGVSSADPDQNFFELGGDSLTAMDLAVRVEEASGESFPVEVLFTDGTLGALLDALSEPAAKQ